MDELGAMLAEIVASQLRPIIREVQFLKSAVSRMVKEGVVEERDAEKGYRIRIAEGENGPPALSYWVPHPEDAKTSVPLKKGQRVMLLCPGGDIRQACIIRTGYSNDLSSPNSDLEANVFADGGYRQVIKDGGLTITAEGQIQITASGGHLA